MMSNEKLANQIAQEKEPILRAWEELCKQKLAAATQVPHIVRRDSMPKLIDALIAKLRGDEDHHSEAAREHGEDRANLEEYSLTEMIFEYRLFRQVLIAKLRTSETPTEQLDMLNDFVDAAIQKATDEYVSVETANRKQFDANELKLRETESQLSLALANAQAGTWYLDIPTNRVYGSAQTAKIYGLSGIDDDLSKAIGELVSPEDQDRISHAMGHAIQTGEPMVIDFKIQRKDGQTRWSHARGSVSYDELGQPVRLSGIQTDITEQKEAELRLREAKDEAERANSAKSAFLANMSHEIRSPLGAIMGFSELLHTKGLERKETERYVDVIDRNAKHLLNVIDDILDLSKVEAGKMTIERIDFSLRELLEDFTSIAHFRATDKGIDFHCKKTTVLPERIVSDPTRIRQILTNIVGNAIKFTEKGLVQLSIGLTGQQLKFIVSDTGTGISSEQATKLFQPFEQADVSTTRRFGGTGLGLALTKRLCEALGGTFKLERSTPGVGSVFVACFEVEISKDQHAGTQATHKQSTDIKLNGMHVLIVDDSPDNQALFSLILNKAGAVVDVASDGFEAINLARTNDYDAIMMDVQMPKMDGHEATRQLRQLKYNIPIIALTAHAMNEERQRAKESGFNDYLSKPVSRDALLATLAKFKPKQQPTLDA